MPRTAESPVLRIRQVLPLVCDVRTRMPFRFGAVTVDALSLVCLRARLEVGGREVWGTGASVSSPVWFSKDPEQSYADKERDVLRAVRIAVEHYEAAPPDTAWALHRDIQPRVAERCAGLGIPALTSSFGVALIDSAVIDGLCRHYDTSFHAALRNDLLGLGPLTALPPRPLTEVNLRHTVGLGDPLTEGDVERRLDDGLPETLQEVIRTYGVRWFKIKIAADTGANLARLQRIAAVLEHETAGDFRTVLDGNESFPDMRRFAAFVGALQAERGLESFRDRLLWFEQPVARAAALEEDVVEDLQRAARFRPVVLDESDGTDEVVEHGLDLGYAGVSAKNCKGVFRTLHSFRVLAARGGGILAAEDLTNPGVLPLHQDTAVVSALGLEHAERNGHHYIRGLAHLTDREQEAALRDYPSLYERTSDGLVRLRIHRGVIDLRELAAAPYGAFSEPDFAAMAPLGLPP